MKPFELEIWPEISQEGNREMKYDTAVTLIYEVELWLKFRVIYDPLSRKPTCFSCGRMSDVGHWSDIQKISKKRFLRKGIGVFNLYKESEGHDLKEISLIIFSIKIMIKIYKQFRRLHLYTDLIIWHVNKNTHRTSIVMRGMGFEPTNSYETES